MIPITVITIGNAGNGYALFVTLSDIQRNKERGKQLSNTVTTVTERYLPVGSLPLDIACSVCKGVSHHHTEQTAFRIVDFESFLEINDECTG